MKIHVPRIVLVGLFAFAAMGSASATPMKASTPARATEAVAARAAENPWPNLASVAVEQPATLLAHDDRYWHDGRRHDRDDWHRENWRREQWRREQARRDYERRRDWQRQHERAMRHRYEADHHYYRR
nr:hypothetical protein [Pseudomonas sp. UBA6315]